MQCRSIAVATSAGVERLNAPIEPSCTLHQRREHNTLCHRIGAYWSGGDGIEPSTNPKGCMFNIIHQKEYCPCRSAAINQCDG
jgi:hypothetical protein